MDRQIVLNFLNEGPYIYRDYVSLGVRLTFKLNGADIVVSRIRNGCIEVKFCQHCNSSFLFSWDFDNKKWI